MSNFLNKYTHFGLFYMYLSFIIIICNINFFISWIGNHHQKPAKKNMVERSELDMLHYLHMLMNIWMNELEVVKRRSRRRKNIMPSMWITDCNLFGRWNLCFKNCLFILARGEAPKKITHRIRGIHYARFRSIKNNIYSKLPTMCQDHSLYLSQC